MMAVGETGRADVAIEFRHPAFLKTQSTHIVPCDVQLNKPRAGLGYTSDQIASL